MAISQIQGIAKRVQRGVDAVKKIAPPPGKVPTTGAAQQGSKDWQAFIKGTPTDPVIPGATEIPTVRTGTAIPKTPATQPVAQPVNQPVTPTTQAGAGAAVPKFKEYKPTNDVKAQIEALKTSQAASTVASFEEKKAQALSNLRAEEGKIQPLYYGARNVASAGSQQEKRNFAEFMAARGGSRSGTAAQAELTRGAQLQGDIGDLNEAEVAAFADIERRRSELENTSSFGQQKALADIDARAAQQSIDQTNQDIINAQNYYGTTGFTSGGERSLQGQTLDAQIEQNKVLARLQKAGLTGELDGQQTLGGKGFDLTQRTTEAGLTGFDPNTGLPTAAEKWQQKGFDANEAQKLIANARLDKAEDYQRVRDSVGDEQWGDQFKLELDEFAWNKNPNNPAQRAQILGNKISELELKVMPDFQKIQLAQLKQDLATGSIGQSKLKAEIANIQKNTKLMGTKSSGGGSKGGGSSKLSKWQYDAGVQGAMAGDYDKFKNMSASNAKAALNNSWGSLLGDYGPDGANALYNEVMHDAIIQESNKTGSKNSKYLPKGESLGKYLGLFEGG